MRLFGLTITRESAPKKETQAQVAEPDLLRLLGLSSADNAMKVAAVYRCVSLISEGIAVMPLRLKRQNTMTGVFEDFEKRDPEHWFYLLNIRPNERMNGHMLKRTMVQMLLLRGNAFLVCRNSAGTIVTPSSGQVAEVILLETEPGYDHYSNTYQVHDPYFGINDNLHADYVIHLKNLSDDGGYWGRSVISRAQTTMSCAIRGEEEALQKFASGGLGRYILGNKDANTPGNYNNRQQKKAAEDIEADLRKKNIITLPDNGLTLHAISMSATDQQFLQSREFSLKDIARWFSVPVYKLGETTSNYKSIDASQVDFYTEALQPLCSQIETELLSKVTTIDDWYRYRFDFDERPLFQLDMDAKAKWMKARLESGVVSVNDLRKEMDLQPVENGDTILMSANLKSISLLNSEGTPTTEPIKTE